MRVAQDLLGFAEKDLPRRATREERDLFNRTRSGFAGLRRIVNGKIKTVDVEWWRKLHGVTRKQVTAKQEEAFQKRLDGIGVMADPARNPNAHQRRMAEEMLAKVQAAGPKVSAMRSAPVLEEYDCEEAKLLAALDRDIDELFVRMRNTAKPQAAPRLGLPKPSVNTTVKPKPGAKPVNTTVRPEPKSRVNTTTPRKPRSADRHLEPNRDRHSPGYMREYMRRRRSLLKAASR
jgi:hypothetical protein